MFVLPYPVLLWTAFFSELAKDESNLDLSLPKFKSLYLSKSGFDLTLVNNQDTIKCHGIVAAANSPFLKEQMEYSMRVTEKKDITYRITLKDCDHDILTSIVNYFYTGDIDISGLDVVETFKIAMNLEMSYITGICIHAMNNEITLHNYEQFMRLATEYSCERLKTGCFNFLSLKFDSLVDTGGILSLNFSIISDLLSMDRSDDKKLEAAVLWLRKFKVKKTDSLCKKKNTELLDLISFERCSDSTIHKVLKTYDPMEITHLDQMLLLKASIRQYGNKSPTYTQCTKAKRENTVGFVILFRLTIPPSPQKL